MILGGKIFQLKWFLISNWDFHNEEGNYVSNYGAFCPTTAPGRSNTWAAGLAEGTIMGGGDALGKKLSQNSYKLPALMLVWQVLPELKWARLSQSVAWQTTFLRNLASGPGTGSATVFSLHNLLMSDSQLTIQNGSFLGSSHQDGGKGEGPIL